MKLKNISKKVINIGTTVVLPDKEVKITKAQTNTPAIKALVRTEYVLLDDSDEKAEEDAKAKAKAEAKAKADAEAEEDTVAEQTEEQADEKPAATGRKRRS